MRRDALVRALREAGHKLIQLMDTSQSSLLVLPYGARVLGLFPGDRANLLWVNPSLGDTKAAIEFFRSPGWRNTGGDRTWISPERDLHVRDLENPWNSYEVTHSIDPGKYTVTSNDHEVRLATEGSVRQHRVGRECAIHLEKSIRLVPNPLRYEPGAEDLRKQVFYAGFEQTTSHFKTSYSPLKSRPLTRPVALPESGEQGCTENKGLNHAPQPLAMDQSVLVK